MKNILILLCMFGISNANACWTSKEKAESNFAELENILLLSFKDAVNCAPVTNAKVEIGGKTHITDEKGKVKLSLSTASLMDERIGIKVSHRDYIPLDTKLRIEAGTVINKRMVMSKKLPPGKVRFVLQWDDEPKDLDLHLIGEDFHISYHDMKSADNKANLDTDEMEGYGPETITLERIKHNETYSIVVDNFSGDNNFTGNETLTVYQGNKTLQTLQLRKGNHRAVHAIDIDNRQFITKNRPTGRP